MIIRLGTALLALSMSSLFAGSAAAGPSMACEREMQRASMKYGVPLGVLYAVGLTESGGKSGLSPYAMNVDGRSHIASSAKEAIDHFHRSKRRGARLIDLGCMQINEHFHGSKFRSLQAMLDPATNVDYAARFLKELRKREKSWTLSVARYHAGPNNNPAQKRYVCTVIGKMVVAGMGAWTPEARSFCG